MKNYIIALIAGAASFYSNAQLLPLQYDTLERNQEVILSAGGTYSGSAIQNDLTSKFLLGGTITTAIKDASYDKHKGVNRLGGAVSGELEYRSYQTKLFKKKDWGLVVKAGYGAYAGSVYSKELFGLMMYGNERYVGDTISFSGTEMNYTSFQKVGFGFIDNTSKSSVTLNVYNIDRKVNVNFRDAELIQAADGMSVELELDGEASTSESAKFNQGIGFGFDLDFKLPVSFGENRTAYVQLQAKNVGVAYMYEPQRIYSVDTTFTYTGFEFDQLIGDDAIVFDSLDVLDTLGGSSELEKRFSLLPGYLQVGKIVDVHNNKRIQSFFGVRLYPTLLYVPYVYAGAQVKATDWLNIGINAGYGGFTNFRAGMYINATYNNWGVGIATEDIIGAVSRKGKGQAIYLRLRCAF